ncbi:XerC/D-like integrase (plasmid) [Natrialba magadii ATCC 43099]|uniref:Integrase family protein n=1 Tax=Natrialba magadii (strain ATCC 43099 / DSM 3394 / CCM 3739 / CIP 104546 / IAM 13178 / JCM 8861 / NBRC 102185 / NCIMB 2190 / MS3) TaxID=547559 RepID=D3T172_NATMM|nr:tyrosine-type recombinase/integrase [Natrialba magadii]ADD07331.1 XerC/D-like integrase [Natrialba magadii ATCC 43099]ELY32587.1 integrase family protein [Natrialba magadii ATCC 43099]
MSSEHYNWSKQSLDELQECWRTDIEPELRRNGVDLTTRPTYQDVTDAGFSGIAYALREHHELTLSEFLATVGYEDRDTGASFQWGIEDESTITELESYLRTLERRRQLAETTVRTKQSRLATYTRLYRELHGKANLVERVADSDAESEEIRRALAVFDELNADLGTDASKLRYHSDVSQFYEHLERRAKASFNPVESIDEEYNWSRADPDNAALSPEQVRTIYAAADAPSDELLVLALCAWGLRRNEVASLHVSQLELESDEPHIVFEERKNGPGTVALIYGVPELSNRVDELGAGNRNWSGYLFPSPNANRDHVTGETVQARFQRLADQADVRVRGERPTSKMGRRFWYTTYNEAMSDLLENLDTIAADQGSADASVVLKNYLSEAERREYRRDFMRERLAAVFGAE